MNPADPSSWNRYAYVIGDPLNIYDPGGLCGTQVSSTFNGQSTGDPSTSTAGCGDPAQQTPVLGSCNDPSASIDITSCGSSYQPPSGTGEHGPPTLAELLALAEARVKADLAKTKCANDFKDINTVLNKLGQISFADLGIPTYKTDSSGNTVPVKKGFLGRGDNGEAGKYNIFTTALTLNTSINWVNPANQMVIIDGVTTIRSLLAGEAQDIGVPSVTADQFMDITILHELAHPQGRVGDPDKPQNERKLWDDCIN